jgi:hypothetical protein
VRPTQLLLAGCVLASASGAGCSRRDSLPPSQSDAAAIVQRQVEAYNAHDVNALVGTYSDSVVAQTLPDTSVMRGKDLLREGSQGWFKQAPKVHADILHRVVLGSFVVDHEHITGTPGGTPLEAVAIYQVAAGRIQRVWFVPPGK